MLIAWLQLRYENHHSASQWMDDFQMWHMEKQKEIILCGDMDESKEGYSNCLQTTQEDKHHMSHFYVRSVEAELRSHSRDL